MPVVVRAANTFDKDLKRLARKYPLVLDELRLLTEQLMEGQQPGDKIPNISQLVYKVRLKNPSARKGKSGGFRIIYYLRLADLVILLTIYAKTEREDISVEDIQKILRDIETSDDSEPT